MHSKKLIVGLIIKLVPPSLIVFKIFFVALFLQMEEIEKRLNEEPENIIIKALCKVQCF